MRSILVSDHPMPKQDGHHATLTDKRLSARAARTADSRLPASAQRPRTLGSCRQVGPRFGFDRSVEGVTIAVLEPETDACNSSSQKLAQRFLCRDHSQWFGRAKPRHNKARYNSPSPTVSVRPTTQ